MLRQTKVILNEYSMRIGGALLFSIHSIYKRSIAGKLASCLNIIKDSIKSRLFADFQLQLLVTYRCRLIGSSNIDLSRNYLCLQPTINKRSGPCRTKQRNYLNAVRMPCTFTDKLQLNSLVLNQFRSAILTKRIGFL